jgi:hypothetical protein
MEFSDLSLAHHHCDAVQHLLDNWREEMFEGNDDLRVSCQGLRTKCLTMGDTLEALLDCDNESENGEPDVSNEVRPVFNILHQIFTN